MKTTVHLFMAILTASLITGCTSVLWEKTNPGEFIEITDTSITVDDLENEHVHYYIDKKTNRMYIEKSGMRKFKDYSIRALATPITITIDAASISAKVLYVVAEAYGEAYADACGGIENQREDREWNRARRLVDPEQPLK